MIRATFKSLLGRKLRLILSGLAVVLGVMFVAGAFVVTDTVKSTSRSAVAALQELGLTTVMVTGDRRETADAVAREVAIDRVVAEVPDLVDLYPLTPLQQGLLFHRLYEPVSGMYFEQFSLVVSERLEARAFEDAWRVVVRAASHVSNVSGAETWFQPLK